MATYRLFDGQAGRPGSLAGDGDIAGFSSPFEACLSFEVTQDNMWLQGYWWWITDLGTMPVAAGQKFCLWQPGYGSNATYAAVIPGSSATSGAMTGGGAWNYIPLAAPLQLSRDAAYVAATIYQPSGGSGFWEYKNRWGTGNPWAAGITNGPLTAFSDQSGSLPAWQSLPQSTYNTPAGTDPAAGTFPGNGNASSFFGMDVQVTDQAPAGASYEIWPSLLIPPGAANVGSAFAGIYTLGTEFILSEPCTLNQIRFYSPSDTQALPTRCAIWDVNTQTVVPGTDNTNPSWLLEDGSAASAGAGRMLHVTYGGVTLPAGKYKTSVFYGTDNIKWFADLSNYWGPGTYPLGVGNGGITSGPVTAPDEAHSDGAAQGSYLGGAAPFGYPATADGAAGYFLDIQVTPPPAAGPSYTASMSSM